MAPLDNIQIDEQAQWLIRKLEDTPYACSSLKRLSGGSANYVYRGVLNRPITSRDGSLTSRTIIIKYSLGHVPGNVEFALDLSRCAVEKSMLHHLKDSLLTSKSIMVPRIYFSHRDTHGNIQVQEDFPQAKDLASIMRSSVLNGFLTRSVAMSVSHEVGSWLRSFHEWTSASQQVDFRQKVGYDKPMQKLKQQVTYGTFISILQNFPGILQDNIEVLAKVKERAETEFEDLTSGKEREHCGIIHGDFWMGNVLLSNIPSSGDNSPEITDIVLIDWELAQFGHRAYDLGHMIGDFYETYHFHDSDSALLMIRGFMDGYGEIDDDMAFRTAIHTGIQLLGWYNRRAPQAPLKGTPEQVASAVRTSTDFIVKGWENDRAWFQHTSLAPLFRNS